MRPSSSTLGLQRLFSLVSDVLAAGPAGADVPDVPDVLCPVLAEALDDPDLLPERVLAHRPPSGFGKHLLRSGPDFSVFCTLTAPGMALPIHDHGSWGVVGVYRGVEEETRYEPSSQTLPGEPILFERGRVLHPAGDVMPVRPPPADIHAVANGGSEWSVCIHLFAEDPLAQGFNIYTPPAFAPEATGPLDYDSTPEAP